MKDQSKKVANLKHKEQVEKNKNAQLMEEARKREDNINESSQQIKVNPHDICVRYSQLRTVHESVPDQI